MTKTIAALALLFSVGCSTVPDASEPAAPAECPAVACGWAADGSCPAPAELVSNSSRIEADGLVCWIYEATCVPAGVDPACVPADCTRNPFTTCEGAQ